MEDRPECDADPVSIAGRPEMEDKIWMGSGDERSEVWLAGRQSGTCRHSIYHSRTYMAAPPGVATGCKDVDAPCDIITWVPFFSSSSSVTDT
ncbi:hypothetical protein VTN96DRAFT_1631 [Rasamsonia emersonii]